MFSSHASNAMKMTERFVAQQRAREIAAKGHSNITLTHVPKKKQAKMRGSRSSFNESTVGNTEDSSSFSSGSEAMSASKGATTWKERQQEVIDVAMAKVDVSMDARKIEQAVVVSKIERHSKMALARLEHSHNTKGK
jgi:hypothetical protein